MSPINWKDIWMTELHYCRNRIINDLIAGHDHMLARYRKRFNTAFFECRKRGYI